MKEIYRQESFTQIIQPDTRIDAHTSPAFLRQLVAAMEDGACCLVIDCQELDYISSAGLRVLSKIAKELKRQKGTIVLCSVKDYVEELFELSGFDSFLPIKKNLEEALERTP